MPAGPVRNQAPQTVRGDIATARRAPTPDRRVSRMKRHLGSLSGQVTAFRGIIESLPLLALIVAAGGLLAFIGLADEVREGGTRTLDNAILLALRQPGDPAAPIGPAWLPGAVRDLTALGSTVVLTLLTLVALGFLLLMRRVATAVLLLVSIGGGTVLSVLLKTHFERARPDVVSPLVDVASLSFPSGHAMLSAVTYLTIAVILTRVTPSPLQRAYVVMVAVAMTLLVGLSRLYLGVHYPSDVLAGWCIGATWALTCWLVARWLQERGAVEKAGPAPDVPAAGERAPKP
jgi:undecaprenyl-diphosphatase